MIYNKSTLKGNIKMFTVFGLWLSSFTISLQAQIGNFAYYQNNIHKAEKHLLAGKQLEALTAYYEILLQADGNFIKDIHNGLLLATELGRIDTFFVLLDLVVGKGLKNEYLVEHQPFSMHQTDPRWQLFLDKNEKALALDNRLRDTLYQLEQNDQYFRLKPGSYSVHGDTIAFIDSINMDIVLDLVANDRFPGEALGGVTDMYGTQPLDIVLHHYTQSTSLDPTKPKITSILVDLVHQGKLMPNKCALWLALQNDGLLLGGNHIFQFSVDGQISEPYVSSYTYLQQTIIAQNRKWLHMEPLVDYYNVVKYVIDHPSQPYIFDVQRQVVEATASEVENWAKKMNQLVPEGASRE